MAGFYGRRRVADLTTDQIFYFHFLVTLKPQGEAATAKPAEQPKLTYRDPRRSPWTPT